MVLDTSALLAILFDEPEKDALLDAVLDDAVRLVAAPTLVELTIVVEARAGDAAGRELDLLLERLRIKVVACTEDHASVARAAWRRYGKGRHSAGLNFGDCFAYAAAKLAGEPLLFKGDDFGRTDVARVV